VCERIARACYRPRPGRPHHGSRLLSSQSLFHRVQQFWGILERFLEVLSFYDQRSLPTPCRHIANSGAVLQLPKARLDLVRPGILLYGIYNSR
jgi:hypothetical protein